MTDLGAESSLQSPAPTAASTAAGASGAALPGAGATVPSPARTAPPQQHRKGHLEAVVRGGSLNMVGAIANSGLSVALVVIIARGFSPAVAGSFWSVLSLCMLLQQAGKLGVDTGVVYFLPRQRVQKRIGDLRQILRLSLMAVFWAGLVTGLLMFLLAPVVADTVLGPDAEGGVVLIRILAVGMPMAMVYDIVLAGTRGFGSMAPGVFLNVVGRSVIQPLLVLGLLATHVHSPGALGLTWFIPFLPTMPIAVVWLRRMIRRDAEAIRAADAAEAEAVRKGQELSGGLSRAETLRTLAGPRKGGGRRTDPTVLRRQFWDYTLPRALASAFQIALTRLDVVLVSAIRGPSQAAVYVAVTRLLVLGQTAVQAVQGAMSPQISALLADDDRKAVDQLYQLATAWLVLVSWPIYLVFASYGPPVLEILGKSYAKSGDDVVALLAIGMLFAAASGPVDVLLLMAGQSRRSLFNRFVALAVNVGIDVVLIPHIGILGAAIGWAVALIVANILGMIQVHGVLGFAPFGPAVRVVAGLAVLFFAVVPLAVRLLVGTSLVGFLIAAVIGTTGYAICVWQRRQVLQLRLLRSLRRRPAPRRPVTQSAVPV